MNYGYVRVSTEGQHEARQIDAMEKAGVLRENLFIDKASGKDFERTAYVKMIRRLKRGDTVFVQSIDRLGRNYEMIIEEWNAITKKIGADIVIMDMPILDTRNGKDLIGTLISDIVLQLLSYVAQTEREHIKERQRQGIEAARKRGVRFGRPLKPLPENFWEAVDALKAGKMNLSQAAELCGMPTSSFRDRMKKESGNLNEVERACV